MEDIIIVGGGISGTALLYVLSNYTNVGSVLLLEKHSQVATVNSHPRSNSQTLHFGDIETNYTLEKASKVSRAAELVKQYILLNDPKKETYSLYPKMVLGVGKHECEVLRGRYKEFKKLFPKMKILDREEIGKIEPLVVKGREENEEISALSSPDGYTMDYQSLAKSFLKNSRKDKKIAIKYNAKVESIKRNAEGNYEIKIGSKVLITKTVIVAAGALSLKFAKELGYGQNLALLSVAGSFFFTPKKLNGKVYTIQEPKLPFAAIHGDPEVHNSNITRWGPTAKVLLMLERYDYGTAWDYFKTAGFSLSMVQSFVKIFFDRVIANYMIRNLPYDWPFIGTRLFVKEVRKIVPTIKYNEVKYAKGYGGNRPQIVDLKTKSLSLGEAKIVGDNILFNITPSPGASTCLRNAIDYTEDVVKFLGPKYKFDKKKLMSDLKIKN
ncbi:MAG: FAD-dependent oxidoreductase [Candidatus Pacearchaeota archaeon]